MGRAEFSEACEASGSIERRCLPLIDALDRIQNVLLMFDEAHDPFASIRRHAKVTTTPGWHANPALAVWVCRPYFRGSLPRTFLAGYRRVAIRRTEPWT